MLRPNHFFDFRILIPWIFFFFFCFASYFVFLIFQDYVISIFFGIILYSILRKPYHHLRKKIKIPKTIIAFMIVFTASSSIVLILVYSAMFLIKESAIFLDFITLLLSSDKLLEYYAYAEDFLLIINITEQTILEWRDSILQNINTISFSFIKLGGNAIRYVLSFAFNFFIAFFISFLMLLNQESIFKSMSSSFPFGGYSTKKVFTKLILSLEGIIRVNFYTVILNSIALIIYFYIFSFNNPIFYGIIGGIASLVPILSTSLVWLPASIYLYTQNGSLPLAIIFALLSQGTNFIIDFLVKVKMLDHYLKIHTMFLFLSILGGIAQFGVKGLILGPFFMFMSVTIWKFLLLIEKKNRQQNNENSNTYKIKKD